jgi:hypothetical protein
MLSFLLSLGLGFGPIDFNQLPVQRVEAIAHEVTKNLEDHLTNKPQLIVTQRPEPTPLGAISYLNGKCVVIINTNESAWNQWGRFLNADNVENWDAIISASVAHEVGHCFKEGRQFVASYDIHDPQLKGLRNTEKANMQPETVFKQELFADAVAVLYAREFMPEQADVVIDTLISARQRFARNDPTHNTAPTLTELLNQTPIRVESESMGGAAHRVLSAL